MKPSIILLATAVVVACSATPSDDRSAELAAREVGNTGGLNYGEFGPPDAYEGGSRHPFYGSENEWSRRMFEERAADLYYKRRGQRQMLEIIDGNPESALALADARLEADPEDAESHYVRTVAFAQLGDVDAAWGAMSSALDLGMPFGRFVAGPRELLAPLTDTDRFRDLAADENTVVVHGPMLGAVTDTSARVWVRTATATRFEVHVVGVGKRHVASGETLATRDYTGEARVDGLQPNANYSYQVVVDGNAATEAVEFRTAPPPGQRGRFEIGFGGCAGYTPENERMWDTIAKHDLRAFLFLGDNVYIDVPDMPGAFHDYSYYRRQSRPEFRRFVGKTAQYAIWDDHDAAFDDVWLGPYVDRPVWKLPMVRHFARNWVNPNNGTDTAPGTWFRFEVGDVEIFMLDGRTYRTNPFIDGRTMLGPEQKAWLLDGLRRSTATFKLVASPVAWSDGAKPDSVDTWSGFAEERDEIFSFVEDNDIPGVILVSSDRHRSEAWKIERESGYPFYEVLSGQLTNIHTHPKEDGALFSYNAKDSFGVLSFDTDRDDPQVTYRIRSIDDEVVNTLVIRLSELGRQQ